MKETWSNALKQLQDNQITASQFVETMKDEVLCYSTPAGETKEGKMQVYILSIEGKPFYPTFFTQEDCVDFFTTEGRSEFMIINGSFVSLCKTLRESPWGKECGIVINFGKPEQVLLSPEDLLKK